MPVISCQLSGDSCQLSGLSFNEAAAMGRGIAAAGPCRPTAGPGFNEAAAMGRGIEPARQSLFVAPCRAVFEDSWRSGISKLQDYPTDFRIIGQLPDF